MAKKNVIVRKLNAIYAFVLIDNNEIRSFERNDSFFTEIKKYHNTFFKFFGIQNLSFKKGFGPRSAGLGAAPQLLPLKIQPQPHSAAVAF